MPTFRPNTLDDKIWNRIHSGTEYDIAKKFYPEDTLIDIGAHIGSFTHTVKQRGAGHVYAYEAHPDNYAVLVKNLAGLEGVVFENKAVTRSDMDTTLYMRKQFPEFDLNPKLINTGGLGARQNYSDNYIEVATIGFDTIIDNLLSYGVEKVRLLKLDCEGAEFPILLTSNRLEFIMEIVGEYHIGGAGIFLDIPHSMDKLSSYLTMQGFNFTSSKAPNTDKLGKFHAWR